MTPADPPTPPPELPTPPPELPTPPPAMATPPPETLTPPPELPTPPPSPSGGGPSGGGPPGGGPPVVEVMNPSDGGFIHWLLKFYAFGLLCVLGILGIAGFFTYLHFATTLPALPDIATYHKVAATTTVVRGWDGTPLAELANERREILSFDQFPPQLVQAFISAEDRRFYEHGGLDYRGIARALGANLRAGEVAQGGSTITQQVAKSFLTSERTIQRKIREAILARRLESRFPKHDILTLYLNQIFLGHGAYGVAAAARRYFDKPVGELDLGEMALLAGLARAPSRFSPLTNLEAARARRDQVLAAMVATDMLTDDEANRWRARPVVVRQRPDFFREHHPLLHRARAPRHRPPLRRQDAVEAGMTIETTVVPWIDIAGQENVDFSLRKLDKRQGWRGPVARLTGRRRRRVPPPRRRPLRRTTRRSRGASTWAWSRPCSPTGGAKVRVGTHAYVIPPEHDALGGPLQRQGLHQRPPARHGGRRAPRRRRRSG